ncbi:MAG: hypothetical protein NTZ10_04710 [Candidatus Saganbacteria bacterium]|nr:hypothetical protein [Candidatus Saganbacteria bacterium]
MKKKILLLSFLMILILYHISFAAEKTVKSAEIYRISVENRQNGIVAVSRDGGNSWEAVGKVLYPCQKVNRDGYTASKWASVGAVAATAVNAIHIRTGTNTEEGKGVVFSIIPADMLNPPEYYNSFLSPDSSIYTNIPAGTSIFGGDFAPIVGNPVSYIDEFKEIKEITEGYVPNIGQTIIISVIRPVSYPRAIIFENKFGGKIRIDYGGDEESVIGEVLKPVQGIGRFQGTQFADVGRIRANHTGVIDVSTSPMGRVGGFQIIPSRHGMSPEMLNARIMTQWMVIGPTSIFGKTLEGQPPLFSLYLQPRYKPMDLDSKTWSEDLLKRFLVEVKINDIGWQPMPRLWIDPDLRKQLPDWANTALKNVTHVRILFPVEN